MTIWAYDIETEAWDKLVCAAAVSETGEVKIFRTGRQCGEWYAGLPACDEIVSHNGGGFDFLQLIAATPGLSWSANMAGSAIVTCRAKGHALCRDSYRLFPLSLAAWTARKISTGLPCICPPPDCGCPPRDCGGYCSIKRSMPAAALRQLIDYCVNDCRVLLETWIADTSRLAADGLDVYSERGIRNTIGAVAWNTGAAMAHIDPQSAPSWADYLAGRAAYYGGRVEVGRTCAEIGHRYDVHAMYPWALTMDVPTGRRRVLVGPAAGREYLRNDLGLYHATVEVPRTDLPPLPHRYVGPAKGRLMPDRLLWSTGVIQGDWSGIELRHAEACGARVQKIDSASAWSDAAPVFRPYVEHVYAMRRKAIDEGDERWGGVLKWYANALSGKLAQRSEIMRLKVLAPGELAERGWHHVGNPATSRVWAISNDKVPSSGHTWMAATLTARSRVKLHDRLSHHSGRWLYCDTDSTYLLDRDERDVHPSALGTWGYEGEAIDWDAMAPKLYRYRDVTGGRYHVRARGVPRACEHVIDVLRDGGTVTRAVGVQRIRTSGGAFVARVVSRSHRDDAALWAGTRHVLPGGVTVPLHRERDGAYT